MPLCIDYVEVCEAHNNAILKVVTSVNYFHHSVEIPHNISDNNTICIHLILMWHRAKSESLPLSILTFTMDVEGVVWGRDHHDVFLLHHHRPEVQLAVGWSRHVGSRPLMQDAHQVEAVGGIALLVGALQLPQLLAHLGPCHLATAPQHKVDADPRHEHRPHVGGPLVA